MNVWTKCGEIQFNPVVLQQEVFVRDIEWTADAGMDKHRLVTGEYLGSLTGSADSKREG
jgi:hypothetical protein